MCFALSSSRSAAVRMSFSDVSFSPLACAIQADAGNIGDGLGLWELAASRLKRGCFLPCLTFQRKARRHRRKPGIAIDGFKPEFFYGVAVVAQLLRSSLLSHLQQGVFHEVQMMRLAWMCRPRPELGR